MSENTPSGHPPPDPIGDLRHAAWLAQQALRTCRTEMDGTRFKRQVYNSAAVARALAALVAVGADL